ncbi:amidohydrolase 2 [Macroventuria anomochaeta]|uniref:Amidohydrolase 2 n=1 Tax=Macroventuria anomochaeta TaxID=301207 RepID=A0ACB6RYM2_9PLEO|nr:amidohydrolase 2 [Macroventuria anomochaeta]KAF2626352.1 amidohydrolase 2 [Macroventuria anomochaeta]
MLLTLFYTLLLTCSTAAAMTLPKRIDVHSHFLPPFYRSALAGNGHSHPDGMPAIPSWSIDAHLSMMKTANVSKSILSISSPGTHIVVGNSTLGRHLTRECNAYAANMKKDDPERFGFWASLPLPDVELALQEIDVASSEGADGFGLMTNYHGTYVGSPALDTIFDRLNELGATVFIHPTKPCIKQGDGVNAQTIDATPFGEQYPVPIFEFFFDTARAVVNLFGSGTVDRCPNVTFIIPHSGGALPPLLTRFIQFSSVVPGGRVLDANKVREQLDKQFYFDLAGFVFDGESGGHGQLRALVEGFEISHERLLYGSDFPFTQTEFVEMFAERMKDGLEHLFSEGQRDAIYEGNAKRLLAGERDK